MDLNLLPLFVSVAETASFSEAARKLGVPRSSVSRGVAALERALRVRLFNRTTRSMALSSAGASLYERVAPQVAGLRRSLGSLPERDETPSGDLRVSAPNDLGATLLPDLLAGFALRYPRVHLDVRLDNRLVDLVAEGFDVALRIASGRLADSSLVARRVSEIQLDLCAAPTYLARRGTPRTPDETAAHEWILFRRQPPPAPFPRPQRRARVAADDMQFVREAVRAGLGIALLPTFVSQADVESGRLVRLLPRHSLRTGVLYFVYPKAENVARKVTAFRDYVAGYIAAHPLSTRSP